MKYFSYHPESGFQLHETEELAKQCAINYLAVEREEAYEGWSDYVDQIFWGEIKQHVVEIMNRPITDQDIYISNDFDSIVDYGLVDV